VALFIYLITYHHEITSEIFFYNVQSHTGTRTTKLFFLEILVKKLSFTSLWSIMSHTTIAILSVNLKKKDQKCDLSSNSTVSSVSSYFTKSAHFISKLISRGRLHHHHHHHGGKKS